MAGDWIPVSTTLLSCPEVLRLSRLTGRGRHEVVGLMVGFWAWVSDHSADGILSGFCPDNVQEMSGADAQFWRAVVEVGWLNWDSDNDILSVPGFEKWLSRGAKARVSDARRKRESRQRNESKEFSRVREPSGKCPEKIGQMSGKRPENVRKKSDQRRGEKRREEEITEQKNKSLLCSSPPETIPPESVVDVCPTEVGRPTAEPAKVNDTQIEEIYEAYPRHEKRADAYRAIAKALKQVAFDDLLSAVREYAHCRRLVGQDERFTPLPASWFNSGRWADDRRNWQLLDSRPPPARTTDEQLLTPISEWLQRKQSEVHT